MKKKLPDNRLLFATYDAERSVNRLEEVCDELLLEVEELRSEISDLTLEIRCMADRMDGESKQKEITK